MNGFFLAGSPILGIGHNQHVGWALTTGGPDTSDVYKMKFKMGLPPKYEYDGKWRVAKMKFITVDIKDAPSVRPSGALHASGPAAHASPTERRAKPTSGPLPISTQMGLSEEFFRMAMARDVHGVYNALGMNQYNEQNVMFADDSGSIAYVRNGATPIRPDGLRLERPGAGHHVGHGLEGDPSDRRPGAHLQSAAGLHGELQHQPRQHDGRLDADAGQVSEVHLQRLVGRQQPAEQAGHPAARRRPFRHRGRRPRRSRWTCTTSWPTPGSRPCETP